MGMGLSKVADLLTPSAWRQNKKGWTLILTVIDTAHGDLTPIIDSLSEAKIHACLQGIALGNEIFQIVGNPVMPEGRNRYY